MDSNGDENISVPELNQKVFDDGIIVERYDKYISTRERCRAAAFLTFLLGFQRAPFKILRKGESVVVTSFCSNFRIVRTNTNKRRQRRWMLWDAIWILGEQEPMV